MAWKPGDEVWVARFWGPKIEVSSVPVLRAGPKEATLVRSHDALDYRLRISHDEGSRSRREALLVLKATAARRVDNARSAVQDAEVKLAAVESALAALEDG